MSDTLIYTIYCTLVGVLGTGFGGILGVLINKTSNKFLSAMLELSSGLMISVVFFDLLPNALKFTNITMVIIGIIIGVFLLNITEYIEFDVKNHYVRLGLVMAFGIALHNFPEGLAIGVSFEANFSLGVSLMFAIFMHDIPEGLALAIPLKMGNMKATKIILISCLTGLFTGLGGFLGVAVSSISPNVIGLSLAIASGAMLYIAICEIIMKSKQIYTGKLPALFNMLGIILGILISKILG